MSDNTKKQSLSYADAGVDIAAGNALVKAIGPMVKATQRKGSMSELGGFAGLFDPKAAGYTDPLLVAATDGVGTKLKLAIDSGQHNTVGIDLVAMCVNDLIVQGAEPLFFLDYFACGALDSSVAQTVISGITDGCKQAGCSLIGGETAEMPGMYGDGDYDLAGFCVGAVERSFMEKQRPLEAGDIILGVGSTGVHSNGFSLVRKILDQDGLSHFDRAPFSPTETLAESLLKPTQIYVKSCLPLMREGAVKAMAHITGGGLLENIPRVLPDDLSAHIDATRWSLPPVFNWLRERGNLTQTELLRTFNCGVGMALLASQGDAEAIMAHCKDEGLLCVQIGTLGPREREHIAISARDDSTHYWGFDGPWAAHHG